MMTAGIGVLRLAPRDFWSMTPRELAAALRCLPAIAAAQTALSRTDLDALMSRFPDAAALPM